MRSEPDVLVQLPGCPGPNNKSSSLRLTPPQKNRACPRSEGQDPDHRALSGRGGASHTDGSEGTKGSVAWTGCPPGRGGGEAGPTHPSRPPRHGRSPALFSGTCALRPGFCSAQVAGAAALEGDRPPDPRKLQLSTRPMHDPSGRPGAQPPESPSTHQHAPGAPVKGAGGLEGWVGPAAPPPPPAGGLTRCLRPCSCAVLPHVRGGQRGGKGAELARGQGVTYGGGGGVGTRPWWLALC